MPSFFIFIFQIRHLLKFQINLSQVFMSIDSIQWLLLTTQGLLKQTKLMAISDVLNKQTLKVCDDTQTDVSLFISNLKNLAQYFV